MRKLFLSLAAAAAVLTAGSITNRAEAFTIGAPAGLATAVADQAVVDKVHCVPGWRHHVRTSWRRANGCARVYRHGYVTTVPSVRFRVGHVHRHYGFAHHHRIHRHRHIHRHHHHRHRR